MPAQSKTGRTRTRSIKHIQMSLLDLRVRRLVCQAMKLSSADHWTGRSLASQADERIAARRPTAKSPVAAD